jgi:uncharacterized damage-inducible protein DinB
MNPQELLETYSQNAQAFIKAAKATPTEKLSQSPSDGGWSPAFVIHHMADSEIQFGARFAKTLSEDNPNIVGFDEEKFPVGLRYEKRSVAISIASFEATHNLNFEILKNASPDDWNRTSMHPEKGAVHLTSWVKSCGGHIGAHLEQLKSIS